MSTTEIPAHLCPGCGRQNDMVTSVQGGSPAPGGLTICIDCATVVVFTADLGVRLLSAEERATLPAQTRRTIECVERCVAEQLRKGVVQ